MSHVVVIIFDNMEEASRLRGALRSLEQRNELSIEDAAVLVKDAKGKVRAKHEKSDAAVTGAVIGGVLGSIVLIMFPGIGFATGAAAGGLVASKLVGDLDKKFLKEVSAAIKPCTSALFLIVGEGDRIAVEQTLRPFKGTLYSTSLPEESSALLRQALKDRE